jgi:hypothetical protein
MMKTSTMQTLTNVGATQAAPAAAAALLELRNYRLRRNRRDDLIALFELHFLDAYERAGAPILATFRNLDDPERWVWIRAFRDEAQRTQALQGFYGSDIWISLRSQANATIADVDDAMLLEGECADRATLAARGMDAPPSNAIYECARFFPRHEMEFHDLSDALAEMTMIVADHGGAHCARLTSVAPTRLDPKRPLRSERAIVTLTRFADAAGHAAAAKALSRSARWTALEARCTARLAAPIERLRLQPTRRSALC